MQQILVRKVKKWTAALLTATLSLSLAIPLSMNMEPMKSAKAFSFAPTVSIAGINPTSPYNPNSNQPVTFSYGLIGFSSSANVTYGIYDATNNLKKTYPTVSKSNGAHSITWDGKFDGGVKPVDANYTFRISATSGQESDGPKSLQFQVKEILPTLTVPTPDTTTYNPSGDPDGVKFTSTLSNMYGSSTARVVTKLFKQSNMNTPVVTFPEKVQGNGDVPTIWDGKIGNFKAPDGNYVFQISGYYGSNDPGTAYQIDPKQSAVVQVKDEMIIVLLPYINQPTVSQSNYDPNNNNSLTFTYSLGGATNNNGKTTATIYKKDSDNDASNDEVIYSNWPTTNNQGTETITRTWNGMNSNGTPAANGSYYLKVKGTAGTNNIEMATKQIGFNIINVSTITNFKATPSTFSPDGDGTNDTTTISFNVTKASQASIYLKQGANLKLLYNLAYTGAGSTVSYVWNGKVDNSTLANGTYGIVAKTSDSDGSHEAEIGVTISYNPVNAPSITNLKATPSTFSPNNDGTSDTTTISFDLSQNAEVTLLLGPKVPAPGEPSMGLQQELYKATKNAGNNINYTWDGKIPGSNSIPANGTWPIIAKVTNSNGNDSETTYVTISNPSITNNCGGFTDVPQDLCTVFQHSKEKGIFLGDSGTTLVRPYDIINRVEAAAVILRGFNMSMFTASGSKEGFSDVIVNQWYMTTGIVRSAKEHGILKGYPDGTLKPAQQVIRAELIVMFLRASGKTLPTVTQAPFLDTPIMTSTSWYIGSINAAKVWGWINAGSYFYPSQGMTRADVAKLFYDSYKAGLNN